MNHGLLKLLIDIDKDQALREQITIEPAKAAAQYKVSEAEIVQCIEGNAALNYQKTESKGAHIVWIHTPQ